MISESERYIYADNAATTPLSPAALEAMMPYLTDSFGNPGGIHRIAREAAQALARARSITADLLGARAGELYFTSGGSESDTWILRGAVRRYRDIKEPDAPIHVVTSSIEHHAVLHTCHTLESEGIRVTYLPVDAMGHVDPSDLKRVLKRDKNVALVSVMLANNEVGTVQNVHELSQLAHEYNVPFHTDAVQAAGHIPVNVRSLDVDSLSISAHKFHGPRGIGALYLKEGFSIPPLIEGGNQERGERAGTENVAGAVGMAAALQEACENLGARMEHVSKLRDRLVRHVVNAAPDVRLTGEASPRKRLPSIASFICKDTDGELLTVLLDRAGVAASTGSACSTGQTEPSHVIEALGITDPAWSRGSIRLSLADDVTDKDIDELCDRFIRCLTRARVLSSPIQSL